MLRKISMFKYFVDKFVISCLCISATHTTNRKL